jgi:hypothetical protein
MKTLIILSILALSLTFACSVRQTSSLSDPGEPGASTAAANATPPKAAANAAASVAKSSAAADCASIDVGEKKVLKAQTFPVDFEPFRGGCFVTSHNPEYQGSPMESEYAIYVDGKKVFDFPDQFNQTAFGCWIDAVAFQDLDADGLTDVIVVGKCSGKSQTYNENMVYVNNGSEFTTDLDANYKLNDFTKAKDIANFAKNNRKLFFH